MASDANAGSHWERVAAELRACREAQQRAWGDIDNTTLGRYLADEVTSEERLQIEGALDELPELRKLTELVRDVLGESETTLAEPAAVPYGPAILPFSPPRIRRQAAARQTVSSERSQVVPSPPNWKQRGRAGRYRQRAGLVAAAGLLLALSVALLGSGGRTSPQSESIFAISQPGALHGENFALADGKDASQRMMKVKRDNLPPDLENTDLGIDLSIQSLKAEGKKEEAETLARHYAGNLTRRGMFYRETGDLNRAEPALNQAQEICARTLGVEAPETVRTRHSLASVYEVALNTVPSSDDLLAADPSTLAIPPAAVQSPRLMMKSSLAPPSPASAFTKSPQRASPAPAVRVSAGYGPLMSAPRSPAPRGFSPAFVKQSLNQTYAAYRMHHCTPAQQTAMIALRERITSQSQSELNNSVVLVLTQALHEATDSVERQRLTRALGQLGPAARKSVPILLDCYHKATGDRERSAILLTLGRIGPAARKALPVLVASLQSGSAEVRQSAARALVQLGPAARGYGQDLAKKGTADPLVHEVMRRINGSEGRIGIDDECDCFSLKTIQHEQSEIRRLAATYHIEVLVETVANQDLEMIDKTGDPQKALGRSSVYLRINKDAGDVQVHVSDALQKQGLTGARLRQALEPYLKNKEYDQSLHAGVAFLAQFEKEHSKK